jgi:hypothetical protein
MLHHRSYFDPEHEPFKHMRESYAPLVWQCRYSGVEVPDQLWRYAEFGQGKPYSDNQSEHMISDRQLLSEFEDWIRQFTIFVEQKGRVDPGAYRAYGYTAPGHRFSDLKLKWRGIQIGLGYPPPEFVSCQTTIAEP